MNTATIKHLERVNNSHMGNPNWRIVFTEPDAGAFITAGDHAFSYRITHNWQGKRVEYSLDKNNKINHIEIINH